MFETRKTDRGHTLKRVRACGNDCPRFATFEVYAPIYRNDKQRVRQTVIAAECRAVRYRRDRAVLADIKAGMTNVAAAAKHGISRSLTAYLKSRATPPRPQGAATLKD